jgi:CRP/FNR family transcriptional regulator
MSAMSSTPAESLALPALRASCASCSMHELCLPTGLATADIERLDAIINRRRKLSRGDVLYRMGERFTHLYAVRLGCFKTLHTDPSGAQQITGFQMAGELLGMDAISTDRHQCEAVALEDAEVCEIPFVQLEALFRELPALQRQFHRLMSKEITREHGVMLLLGNMRAEQRMAAFLLNLSARYAARGYAANSFQLRMSRVDIGNYLGLTIESISRLLTRFKAQGLIAVNRREIVLNDCPALQKLVTDPQ